jgi:Tol biopolymer transport system component
LKQQTSLLYISLVLLVFNILGCQSLPQAAIQPDRIVYSAYVPENWDIYYFNKPGEPGRVLTTHAALDYEPAFSPDGRWVVFTSERNGSPDLFALDLHKSDAAPKLLINSAAMEDQVAFSPDGKRIFFVSTETGNADIFSLPFRPDTMQTMDQAVNLTRHPGGDFRPSVSPDGARVAFSSDRDTPTVGHHIFKFARQREGEIYIVDAEGANNPERITHVKDWDGSPVWSADGQSLFYYSAGGRPNLPQRTALTQEGGFRIWSVALNNPIPRAISPIGVEALWPALTPEGRIAFATRDDGGYGASWRIVSIKQDGSDLREESDAKHSYWAAKFNSSTGAMVAHGTGTLEEDVLPGCGFAGQLLAGGSPAIQQFQNKTVQLYGMRHAFSVAPHPHKDRIAFHCQSERGGQIFTANPDGSDAKEVVNIEAGSKPRDFPFGIKWSKDGRSITYMVGPFWGSAEADADVRSVNNDGTGRVNHSSQVSMNDGMPSYSKDGQSLVFRSGRTGNFDLYIMPVSDASKAKKITAHPSKDNFPVFSPTSDLIAFISDRDGVPDTEGYREFDIYTLQPGADGEYSVLQRITDTKGQDAHVQFSPDGKWLIYASEQGGINDEEPLVQELFFGPQMYGEIYAYRLSDGYQVRLTHNKWEDGAPFWVGPSVPADQVKQK